MPVFEVTYPQGALSDDVRAEMLERLTTALLRAERAPDTQFFRDVTWSYIHELPQGAINAAGRPVEKPTFKIDVTTPEGALSDRRRAELVASATAIVRELAGIDEAEAIRVWVLCHEVAEGSWGAAGNVIQFQQLVAAAKSERERAEEPAPA